MELIRISTAGSVDDGKSTLIGRLLYDTHALTREQQELVERKTREKGWEDPDLSVITDGLIAEREQGITIDVAHIYFSTETRKFIIADSPGHVEYTRNMVTGASTSEVSVILVDARKGLLEQSFRHFYISQLLRLRKVVFCVNKMDLAGYSEDVFLDIAIHIRSMVNALNPDICYDIIPISSLKGDNVVHSSTAMPWYQGPTLNELLHAETKVADESLPFRFDVQHVIHSQENGFTDYRGYSGRVVSGKVAPGDRITVFPSGRQSVVTELRRYVNTCDIATAGDSITIRLADDIDISRGAVFSSPDHLPSEGTELTATLVWMDERPVQTGSRLLLKAASREFPVKLQQIVGVTNPVHPETPETRDQLELNDIALVELKLSQPSYLDPFAENRQQGIFLLIDPQSNHTVALGLVK